MSKKISALILLGGLAGMMTSCTDEPLNAECDIEAVSLHFEEPERLMYHDYDTLQTVPSVVDSVSFLIHIERISEHHRSRKDSSQRISLILTCDIGCRTVTWLIQTELCIIERSRSQHAQ